MKVKKGKELQKKGITINDLIPTERLSYIGKRGMGALEYEPVLDNISDYKQSNIYSYEQVFTVLRRMQLQYKNIEQQYKRMVFNVVARNQD